VDERRRGVPLTPLSEGAGSTHKARVSERHRWAWREIITAKGEVFMGAWRGQSVGPNSGGVDGSGAYREGSKAGSCCSLLSESLWRATGQTGTRTRGIFRQRNLGETRIARTSPDHGSPRKKTGGPTNAPRSMHLLLGQRQTGAAGAGLTQSLGTQRVENVLIRGDQRSRY